MNHLTWTPIATYKAAENVDGNSTVCVQQPPRAYTKGFSLSLIRGCVAHVWVHQNLFVEVIDKKGKQKSVGAIAESKAKEAADGGAGAGAGAGAGVDGDDVRSSSSSSSSSSLPCERLWRRRTDTHLRPTAPQHHTVDPSSHYELKDGEFTIPRHDPTPHPT